MTVIVHIGRRVPKSWFKRQAGKVKGMLTFQENIWLMICQSMSLGKKKCNASGKGKWVTMTDRESEDLHYEIEWKKHIIQGSKEFEIEEHEEAQQMYKAFGRVFKNQMPAGSDAVMRKHFKSKLLSATKIEEAYEKGYGDMSEDNIANKLLEMGVLTHIELQEDWDSKEREIYGN